MTQSRFLLSNEFFKTPGCFSKDNVSRWTFLRPVGKDRLDSGLDWTGLGGNFFWGGGCITVLVFKKYRVFNLSPTGYIFSFGVVGGRGEV